jgi:hypothetical protein
MRLFSRFALVPLATLLTGIGSGLVLAVPARADVSPGTAAACQAAFSGPTEAEVQLVTDPPARSDASPGQQVRLDASWVPGAWESLSSVDACVRVDRVVDRTLSSSESPAFDDGAYGHAFAVPDGLFNGTAICTRVRLAGDPVGEATEAVWVSKQACFEVHPEEDAGTPTAPTTSPTTSPTTPPTTAPVPAPTPSPTPTTVPQSAPAPTVPQSAPPVERGAPGQEAAGGAEAPASRTPETGSTQPIALPLLPATGTDSGGLASTGMLAVAVGVPILALARLRRRPVR